MSRRRNNIPGLRDLHKMLIAQHQFLSIHLSVQLVFAAESLRYAGIFIPVNLLIPFRFFACPFAHRQESRRWLLRLTPTLTIASPRRRLKRESFLWLLVVEYASAVLCTRAILSAFAKTRTSTCKPIFSTASCMSYLRRRWSRRAPRFCDAWRDVTLPNLCVRSPRVLRALHTPFSVRRTVMWVHLWNKGEDFLSTTHHRKLQNR